MTHVILTVDDDELLRMAIRETLEEEGFRVREAESAERALEIVPTTMPDLILVDSRLPGMNGHELVRRLRRDSTVPIVMVSALADSHDVVAGLEVGADDYISKPFVIKELSARVRAHLRRVDELSEHPEPERPGAQIRVGDVEVRVDEAVVLRDGEPVGLTKTEFQLLCELAANVGIVLSRDQLLERVWGYEYLGDTRLVDAHISRLRTKIDSDPAAPSLITTVRGLGYRLEC